MEDAELLRWLLRAVAQEPGLRCQVEGRLATSSLSPFDKLRLHNLLARAAWDRGALQGEGDWGYRHQPER
jgi:hypothetical protein